MLALSGSTLFRHTRRAHHSIQSLQAARDAVRAIKRLQARTETGLTYSQYVDAVGTAWAEIKPFVDSPEGSEDVLRYPLKNAIDEYKSATESWHSKILFPDDAAMYEESIQSAWNRANSRIKEAEAWLKVSWETEDNQ